MVVVQEGHYCSGGDEAAAVTVVLPAVVEGIEVYLLSRLPAEAGQQIKDDLDTAF